MITSDDYTKAPISEINQPIHLTPKAQYQRLVSIAWNPAAFLDLPHLLEEYLYNWKDDGHPFVKYTEHPSGYEVYITVAHPKTTDPRMPGAVNGTMIFQKGNDFKSYKFHSMPIAVALLHAFEGK